MIRAFLEFVPEILENLFHNGSLILDSQPGRIHTAAGVAWVSFAEGLSGFRKHGLLVNVRSGRKMFLEGVASNPGVCLQSQIERDMTLKIDIGLLSLAIRVHQLFFICCVNIGCLRQTLASVDFC